MSNRGLAGTMVAQLFTASEVELDPNGNRVHVARVSTSTKTTAVSAVSLGKPCEKDVTITIMHASQWIAAAESASNSGRRSAWPTEGNLSIFVSTQLQSQPQTDVGFPGTRSGDSGK
jgi:hypothetical protein